MILSPLKSKKMDLYRFIHTTSTKSPEWGQSAMLHDTMEIDLDGAVHALIFLVQLSSGTVIIDLDRRIELLHGDVYGWMDDAMNAQMF
jgi:hypothetical protein